MRDDETRLAGRSGESDCTQRPEGGVSAPASVWRRRQPGWVVALVFAAGFLTLASSMWRQWWLPELEPTRQGTAPAPLSSYALLRHALPDGGAEAWGYNFKPALVARDQILPGRTRLGDIPPLIDPAIVPVLSEDVLTSSSPVLGVAWGGQSRAYPLWTLRYHECVNDTLGGRPIVVTYSPLTHSLMVFDRRPGGRETRFAASGLWYQSNTLIIDLDPDPARRSLWSQLGMRAVCGPAAGEGSRLELLDSELTSWRDWLQRHPETTLLSTATSYSFEYGRSMAPYLESPRLLFPVNDLSPRRPDLAYKTPMVLLVSGAATRAYALRELEHPAGGELEDEFAGEPIALACDRATSRVTVRSRRPGAPPGTPPGISRAYAAWFAWDTQNPDGDLYGEPRESAGLEIAGRSEPR